MPFADILSGASSPIASLISGVFGSSNTNKTNKANMKIAQMNNEWNAVEAAKNRDWMEQQRIAENEWNEKMWNMNNEYNSASAIRERNEAAGLNPYFADSGVPSGQVSSASTGSASAPTAEPVRQIPFLPKVDLSSISTAINSYFSNQESMSRTAGNRIENDLRLSHGDDFMLSEIAGNVDGRWEMLDPRYRRGRVNDLPNLLGIDLDMRRESLESVKIHNQLEVAQRSLAYLNASAQKTLNKHLDAQQQADLWIKASQVFMNYQQGYLTEKKLRTEVLNQVKISLENKRQRIDNRILSETADSVISAMKEESEYNAGYYRFLKRYASTIGEADKNRKVFEALSSKYDSRNKKLDPYFKSYDRAFDALKRYTSLPKIPFLNLGR